MCRQNVTKYKCLLVLMLVGRVLYTTQEFGGTAINV
nr:unnamed protein product [Callosobruchus analis]